MTTREPPNLRSSDRCNSCKHLLIEWSYKCKLYDVIVQPGNLCDDYSPEGEVEE